MDDYNTSDVFNLIQKLFSFQWCAENLVAPIRINGENTKEGDITIAIGDITYLGTIGEFIKHRARAHGLSANFIEMAPEAIANILEESKRSQTGESDSESTTEMHDDAIIEALIKAEEGESAAGYAFEFEDSEDIFSENNITDLSTELAGSQIQRAAAQILITTCRSNVSDIHIEPLEDSHRIRVRRDGVMQDFIRMPRTAGTRLTACLKNMSGMNIAERQAPQQGTLVRTFEGDTMRFQCATAPVVFGEKMVVRITNSDSLEIGMDVLITDTVTRDRFRKLLKETPATIICSGRVGSGKSTTLAAALREKDNGELSIVTIEDPIEYKLGGSIQQTQIAREKNQTTRQAYEALMCTDPDVMLIGETRDPETAELFFKAAESGLLALTTVHAASCAQALRYFQLLGVPKHKLNTQKGGILAQQLLRRVCPDCSTSDTCSDNEAELLSLQKAEIVRRAKCLSSEEKISAKQEGDLCRRCGGTGFQGRIAAYELLEFTPAMQDRLSQTNSLAEIQETLDKSDFVSMRHYARRLVLDGITTPTEALKTVYESTSPKSDSQFEEWAEGLCRD